MSEFPEIFTHFTVEELACPDTGEFKFHPRFPEFLESLRQEADFPFPVNSCCRSKAYNATLPNSSVHSLHIYDEPTRGALGTMAIDVKIVGAARRAQFVRIALSLGFSLYFINEDSIHIDLRTLLGEEQILFGVK